ncbi:MAG: LL-diaminopimelate aminotransferase [Planctomycetota bacterium]|nr:LL-diaminopimelate aminotransferase [Planctomycetota bacterium]
MQTKSDRLKALPPYLFAEIDRKKKAAIAAGRPVIHLGIGDPDTPTPDFIIRAAQAAVADPATHQYALDRGDLGFRKAIAAWHKKRFGVTVDPETEILPAQGSKDTLSHLPLALMNPGEVGLVPDPGYPVYASSIQFAGGTVVRFPITADRNYLPDLEAFEARDLKKAKFIYLNYPNNPTAASATLEFYEEVVAWAQKHQIVVAQDAAYSEVYFEDPPPSILEIRGAKDVAVEFYSCSKTFNMTGWRVGWVAGNAAVIESLVQIKSNMDNGVFTAMQRAGAAALEGYDRPEIHALRAMYKRRRDCLVAALTAAGLEVNRPQATFYVWIRCPGGLDSRTFADRLLSEADIVATPGIGYGPHGEGYIRMALTVPEAKLEEAAARIKKLKF